jgi:hypothetical protein
VGRKFVFMGDASLTWVSTADSLIVLANAALEIVGRLRKWVAHGNKLGRGGTVVSRI